MTVSATAATLCRTWHVRTEGDAGQRGGGSEWWWWWWWWGGGGGSDRGRGGGHDALDKLAELLERHGQGRRFLGVLLPMSMHSQLESGVAPAKQRTARRRGGRRKVSFRKANITILSNHCSPTAIASSPQRVPMPLANGGGDVGHGHPPRRCGRRGQQSRSPLNWCGRRSVAGGGERWRRTSLEVAVAGQRRACVCGGGLGQGLTAQ